jgi:hypothetical protein
VPAGWRSEDRLAVRVAASDNVGVASLKIMLNEREAAADVRTCFAGGTNSHKQPCGIAPQPLEANLELGELPSGQHRVRVVVDDVAGNRTEKSLLLWTDREPPGAPRALRSTDADGWRSENRFGVEWVTPPADGSSPVSEVEYELCPAANRPHETSGCVNGRRSAAGAARIDDLAVPGAGEWRLRLALRDAAGNLDWDRSAVLEGLRFDGDLPRAAFLPFDPVDPTRVRLAASDDTSGIRSVEVEARLRGASIWHTLPVSGAGNGYSAVLDDDSLPSGTYDLRARVVDHAGNERSTTTLAAGDPLVVQLPIRSSTALAVGRPERVRVNSAKSKRPRYRRVLVAKPQANYGDPVEIEGKLTDPVGNPLSGAAVDVLERVNLPGLEWRQLAMVQTQSSGTFRFRASPGPARSLRFFYRGTATNRSRSEDVELEVRAGVTLAPSRRRVRNGDEILFRGRVLGRPVPEAGKLLALQAQTSSGWRTFATPRARAGDGRFSVSYRFTGTPYTTRYAFRVIAPRESSYPYAWGASKVARVLVRGDG